MDLWDIKIKREGGPSMSTGIEISLSKQQSENPLDVVPAFFVQNAVKKNQFLNLANAQIIQMG